MIKNLALVSMMLLTMGHAKDYGTVNGEPITKADVDVTIAQTGMQYDSLDDTMKKRVLEMVVDRKLIAQVAEKSGIEKSKAYLSQLEALKKELVFTAWINQELEALENSLTDEALQKHYKENKAEYFTPKKLQARHVLVPDEKVAKEIIKEIDGAKDKKAKVIELAKKHEKTTGPSDLGWFELGKMVPAFSAAADKLKIKTYSKTPVKTQFGYHVIYLEGRKEGMTKPFEVVKKQMKSEISNKEFALKMKAKTDELRKTAKIELK